MPTFYLVVDEFVPVDTFQFRVRMWRQSGSPPHVLFSQVPGGIPLEFYSTYLANLALRSFLGDSLPIPVSFELARWDQDWEVSRVRYQTIGCDLRPILEKPDHTKLKPSAVEQFFGTTLDSLV
jgi:hypothetical protein